MVVEGPVLKPDGRQSETAAGIQRGLARLLRAHDYVFLTEFTLASGRRADVIGLSPTGVIWIIEIKSSAADFLADSKWHDYLEFCDRFSFAIPPVMDQALIPAAAGLILADPYGAEILRPPSEHVLHASRRKAMTQGFARAAALRLQPLWEAGFSQPQADT